VHPAKVTFGNNKSICKYPGEKHGLLDIQTSYIQSRLK
jgi:hypothetical protein